MITEKRVPYIILSSTTFVTLCIFRSLLSSLTTGLFDWFDYPYYVWTLFQTIEKLSTLSFNQFYSGNAFYPFESTLLFSDLLLPQSGIGFLFSLFTRNPILVFNLTLITTLLLNNVAGYFFWKQIFSNWKVLLFMCVVTAAFPFLFLQLGHFQMITLWPFFLGLGLLFTNKKTTHHALLLGITVTIQFLASVYLALFLLTTICIWGVVTLANRPKKSVRDVVVFLLVSIAVFAVTTGPTLLSYLQVKNAYGISREYGEYVLYAAQPSDYLFNASYTSALSQTSIFQKVNNYDWHTVGEKMAFPGFVLTILGAIGLFEFKSTEKHLQISLTKSSKSLLFLILLTSGFIFSLGPKLTVNGSFTGLPLPYAIVLKFVPIFEPIRATGRWGLLFYVGLLYFAGKGLTKILVRYKKSELLVVAFLLFFYLFEVAPTNKTVQTKEYYTSSYVAIEKLCKQAKQVLLEYPLTQDFKEANVATNLSYKTTQLLASLHHGCFLVNGYAGYDPLDYARFEQELSNAVHTEDEANFKELLEQRSVTLVKLNKKELYQEKVTTVLSFLRTYPTMKVISENDTSIVVALK